MALHSRGGSSPHPDGHGHTRPPPLLKELLVMQGEKELTEPNHPYVITLRWNRQPALVCVDMSKR
ncbi:MAG: hypothetical protein HY854_06325 [Burkholderiales bacterium]|nr:hypothetical protein [Burkholderiales bacterium]